MRLYHPLTKPNGRVMRSNDYHTNPYYGKRGAAWVKDSNASLYSAQRETFKNWHHVESQVSRTTLNIVFMIGAIIGMVLLGFLIYAIAIGL